MPLPHLVGSSVNRSEMILGHPYASLRLMRLRFSEIASKLTGISTPIGGVSWEPTTPDVEVAFRVITFLEDRRVLFSPLEAEIPEQCIESVLQIRQFLTSVLANQGIGTELAGHLRGMRVACHRFLDWFTPHDLSSVYIPHFRNADRHIRIPRGSIFENWELNQALGELRASFGLHIAQIAAKYKLDLEEPLSDVVSAVLPEPDDEE